MKYIHNRAEQFFAFNVWDVNSAKSIIDAAAKFQKAVILQTSARIFQSLDKKEFYQYIKSYAEQKNVNAYIHLDHCRDFQLICEAIYENWDSVMFDGAHLNIKENIRITNEICEIAHANNVLVEAEIGQIKGAEEDIVVSRESIADINEIKIFLKETKIDLFAAAIGTAHGLYRGIPQIHYEIISEIAQMSDLPFVIHGGTGLSEEVFRKLLSYKNVKKINISTDVKQAYRGALVAAYKDGLLNKEKFEPALIEKKIHNEIMKMAGKKFELLIK